MELGWLQDEKGPFAGPVSLVDLGRCRKGISDPQDTLNLANQSPRNVSRQGLDENDRGSLMRALGTGTQRRVCNPANFTLYFYIMRRCQLSFIYTSAWM